VQVYVGEQRRNHCSLWRTQLSSSQRVYAGLKPEVVLLLWLYFSGAAIFIGGEINSPHRESCADEGNFDVRRPEERRSSGTGSDASAV
jgi:uncharacterized BrkB/YihY/UPF0761 family membrane protein